jgi:hypothetical protein
MDVQVSSSNDKKHNMRNINIQSTVYGLGFIGALIYYLQHATTFWIGVLGFLKAIVWPTMLIYRLFGFLQM